jgi:hypothetical protein
MYYHNNQFRLARIHPIAGVRPTRNGGRIPPDRGTIGEYHGFTVWRWLLDAATRLFPSVWCWRESR